MSESLGSVYRKIAAASTEAKRLAQEAIKKQRLDHAVVARPTAPNNSSDEPSEVHSRNKHGQQVHKIKEYVDGQHDLLKTMSPSLIEAARSVSKKDKGKHPYVELDDKKKKNAEDDSSEDLNESKAHRVKLVPGMSKKEYAAAKAQALANLEKAKAKKIKKAAEPEVQPELTQSQLKLSTKSIRNMLTTHITSVIGDRHQTKAGMHVGKHLDAIRKSVKTDKGSPTYDNHLKAAALHHYKTCEFQKAQKNKPSLGGPKWSR